MNIFFSLFSPNFTTLNRLCLFVFPFVLFCLFMCFSGDFEVSKRFGARFELRRVQTSSSCKCAEKVEEYGQPVFITTAVLAKSEFEQQYGLTVFMDTTVLVWQ